MFYRSIIYISVLETCSHKMDKTKFTMLGSQILADYTIDWESRLFYLIWQLYYDFFDANGYIHISSTDAAIFLISFLIKLDRFSTKEVITEFITHVFLSNDSICRLISVSYFGDSFVNSHILKISL